MKAITHDGKEVKEGDLVWVCGSVGDFHQVRVLPPCTEYELFGPVPVAHSFSTKKAAKKARDKRK